MLSARVQSPWSAQQGPNARAAAAAAVAAAAGSSAIVDQFHHRRRCGSPSSSSSRPLLLARAGAPAAQPRRRGLPSPAPRPLSSLPRARTPKRGGDDNSEASSSSSSLADLAASITRSWLFRVPLQGLVALVVLAAVDAAYSGDWSRIGAISKGTEEALKPLVVALGCFHIVCAGVAGVAASKKGNSVPKAVAKAALVGFLAATEAAFAAEGEEQG